MSFLTAATVGRRWVIIDRLRLRVHSPSELRLDRFYCGLETQVYGGDGYRQWRLGVHITSMKTGDTEWSAAGGLAVDTGGRSSLYLRLGVLQRP